MSKFTVRVVLNDADWDDYTALHAYMKANGFSKTITADDGKTYLLPDAEYNFIGNKTSKEILDLAKKSANKTNRKYSILVTKAISRTWFNLEQE